MNKPTDESEIIDATSLTEEERVILHKFFRLWKFLEKTDLMPPIMDFDVQESVIIQDRLAKELLTIVVPELSELMKIRRCKYDSK